MANILPFYLVCDESGSMSGAPIQAMNDALPELHEEIGSNPVVCDKTRFAIVTFSDRAEVLQPLEDLSQLTQLPTLQAKGGTNYGEVFRLLKNEIESDRSRLKGEGHRVFRPTVFFLSDGYPTDKNWEVALDALTDSAWSAHPNVLAFGIEQADPAIIGRVGVTQAFMVNEGMSPAVALKEFATSLTRSIINSGAGSGDALTPMMPTEVPGFTPVPGFVPLPADEI